jgi:hypothetical protein
MSKIEFVKNEKENEPRILVFVDGIKINTIGKNSIFEFTVSDTFFNCVLDLSNIIKSQTGLDVTCSQILDAYEQYRKENK